ncbi:uncharacterized protein LOC127253651 isoform X2 [Andrographis paniculata]|uniref:uncharacterized protein LOC127253651 isoform X2 n=1 Tax=Andrographis paniculata TaxID=175694 RepID=UPI0021E996BD|nr:uncharacterized protein LOC127253651 isoform X2 [Andrographis paniculata]
MASLSGFRPPQFSESDAWLPVWLQKCGFGELNVEGIGKDCVTFEQRVEELKFLQESMDSGSLMREEGGCTIGQLFISGTDSLPLSFPHSADNVVQLHLRLSSDGNSDNTTLTAGDVNQTESSCPHEINVLQSSSDLAQKDKHFQDSGIVDCSPAVILQKSVTENEFLGQDKSVNVCEDASDAVELCVAASEALEINKAVGSDSPAKTSASAILEASLQVKQARLALSTNTCIGTVDEAAEKINLCDIDDNLSDLDDLTMRSAYEDAGIHFNEFLGDKLSVSQVKDTFSPDYDESFNHEMASASANGSECSGAVMRRKLIGNRPYGCLRRADKQHRVVSARTTVKSKLDETNEKISTLMNNQVEEKYSIIKNISQDRFQSRWLGGWTRKYEEKVYNTVTHRIPKPFVQETSFFSESADAAPDDNSSVQNLNKGTIIASQLSIPSEHVSNRAKSGMLLSQDVVRSSSTSFVDPLCSVVPCSISEHACSSPAQNYEHRVSPGYLSLAVEQEEGNVVEAGPLNKAASEEDITDVPVVNKTKESEGEGIRPSASLRNHSKLLPRHTKNFKRDGHRKRLLPIHSNIGVTFGGTCCTNYEGTAKDSSDALQKLNSPTQTHGIIRIQRLLPSFDCPMHDLTEDNASQTALLKNKVKSPTGQDLQNLILQSKSYKSSPKHVHFLEKETSNPNNKKHHKVQTLSKTGYFTKAVKRSTRTSAHLESKAHHMDRFLKGSSYNEKKRLIFQNMEFLLTGFSQRKEKEIEGLIRKYGGIVLSHIPPKKGKRSSKFKLRFPIVLCLKKTQSMKFLYGCAVNAFVLKVNWLIDSIAEGCVLPKKRYMIWYRNTNENDDQVHRSLVFNNLGVMLHGKTKYVSNIATIIEHGGGMVFKTLQRLIQTLEAGRVSMAVVVADQENCSSRHLKQCALEQNIPVTSIHWIIKSLYAGKLIPFEEKKSPHYSPAMKLRMHQDCMELSQEI